MLHVHSSADIPTRTRDATPFFMIALSVVSAGYQLPRVSNASPAAPIALAACRARAPTLGFFDDMKKGFEAGMASSSSSDSLPQPQVDKGKTEAPSSSIFDGLRNAFFPEPLTQEEEIAERKKRGEGVVWSGGYARAWKSVNGLPQEEITVQEAKDISRELGIEIPAALESADGTS